MRSIRRLLKLTDRIKQLIRKFFNNNRRRKCKYITINCSWKMNLIHSHKKYTQGRPQKSLPSLRRHRRWVKRSYSYLIGSQRHWFLGFKIVERLNQHSETPHRCLMLPVLTTSAATTRRMDTWVAAIRRQKSATLTRCGWSMSKKWWNNFTPKRINYHSLIKK